MEKSVLKIDFSRLGGPVFVGRDRGARVREKFNLDMVDESDSIVDVIIPENTYSINPSFFLALFGQSIRKCGSKEKFIKKYRFAAPEHIMTTIDAIISRALLEKSVLIKK